MKIEHLGWNGNKLIYVNCDCAKNLYDHFPGHCACDHIDDSEAYEDTKHIDEIHEALAFESVKKLFQPHPGGEERS